ncbi:MAG: acyl-CoA dehydrogenase family protein [Candidatus Electryonea clarkiae]|nr:acyl-CoA dehydrogenase family protein [Candidatus Electryonea clarkiae]MDP8287593.1 acyl-CoA dehydrogenase family protein [Candidatus Electryonea clarkiae]
MSYEGIDYYRIDDLLNDEERRIRDDVREWVSTRLLPVINKHYNDSTFPNQLIPEMADLGLLGITLSPEYGGKGHGYVSYGLAMQELERGDSGIRSFASVQNSLVIYPILTWGTEEQKKFWLPKLASGEKIGSYGLVEPGFGSNPGGLITTARKVDGGYILNGKKRWITNSPFADVNLVWAKLDGEIAGFLVEKGSKGLNCPEITGKWSLRASITGEILMDAVFVPDTHRLEKANGLASPLMCLSQARYGIAWGVLGAMQDCYDSVINYAKTRNQWGKSIGGFQLVQDKLVTILNEITLGQLLVYRLGRLKESGKANFRQISLAKRNNCQKALEVARIARDLLGAEGILEDYPVMRHMANLESVYTYEGTHHMHTLIVGSDITGIEAYEG